MNDLFITNGRALSGVFGQPDNHGGAIFNDHGHLTISSSRIANSQANLGAGISNYGEDGQVTLILRESIVEFNEAQGGANGGGIFSTGFNGAAVLQIENSTIANNRAEFGGAISQNAGNLTINNSTISGNEAVGSIGFGGGIFGNGSTSTVISNSTITGNRALDENSGGGGIRVNHAVTLHNTIVAGNVTGAGSTPSDIDGFITNGSLIDPISSYNLIGDAATAGGLTNGVNHNLVGVDPSTVLESTLANNGGPTPTHALIEDGPAIDTGAPERGVAFDDARAFYSFDASDGSQAIDRTANNLDGSHFKAQSLIDSLSDALNLLDNHSPVATGTVAQADFHGSGSTGRWSIDNPIPGNPLDHYAFVATGTLEVTTDNVVYAFAIGADDGGRLRIDHDLNGFDENDDVATDVRPNSFRESIGTLQLDSGSYPFEWVGFDHVSGSGFELSVVPTDGHFIPQPVSTDNGWKVFGDPAPHPEIRLTGSIDVSTHISTDSVNTEPRFAYGQFPGDEAVELNGIDEYVELPDVYAGHDFADGFSFEAWVYPTAVKAWSRIFEMGQAEGETGAIRLFRIGDTDNLRLRVHNGQGSIALDADNALSSHVWQHFAVTVEGTGFATIYKNGELIQSGVLDIPTSVPRPRAYLGRSLSDIQLFEGRIDQAGFYDRALTETEIRNYAFDQRGVPFARFTDGNNDGVSRKDIGAFEIDLPSRLLVNSTSDVDDGAPNNGMMTLREAVNLSNSLPGRQQIDFDFGDTQTIIVLDGSELLLSDDVAINGPGKNLLMIDADNRSRVFHVTSGVATELHGLDIVKGVANSGSFGEPGTLGGAIFNERGHLTISSSRIADSSAYLGAGIANEGASGEATLVLRDSHVEMNTASGDDAAGGGIYNSGVSGTATLRIENSTVSENNGELVGGIYNVFGSLEVNNSTLSSNQAVGNVADSAGAIFGNSGSIAVSNSTVVANQASHDSGVGGIQSNQAVQIHNSIVAGNVSGTAPNPSDIGGHALDPTSSYNLLGDSATAGGLSDGANNNIVGRDVSTILELGLADNGGPTPTHALIGGSPAIDAGALDAGVSLDDALAFYTFGAADGSQVIDLTSNNFDGEHSQQLQRIESLDGAQIFFDSATPIATGMISQADLQGTNGIGKWNVNNPIPGNPLDYYAIRATGTLEVTASNTFGFAIGGDDGGRLRIDRNLDGFDADDDVVVDAVRSRFSETFGTTTLDVGNYPFEWVGFEAFGDDGFELSVSIGDSAPPYVSPANGWKIVGDSVPHPQIRLAGQISVATYAGDATANSNRSITDGRLPGDEAVQFNGIDEFVSLPDIYSGHDFSEGLSIEAWVYPTAVKNSARIVGIGNDHGVDQFSLTRAGTSDAIMLEVGDDHSWVSIGAPDAISLNAWQHFAATVDGNGAAAIYKDGELIASGFVKVPETVPRSQVYIGKGMFAGNELFEGRMDHVAFYDRALTDADIRDHFFDQRGVPFARDINGNNDRTPGRDIGAFEKAGTPNAIGVNFGSDRNGMLETEVTEPAGFLPQSNWNNVSGKTNEQGSLIDSFGNETSTHASWEANYTWTVSESLPADAGNSSLYKSYIDTDPGSTSSITFTDLPYSDYDAYIYFDGDGAIGLNGIYTANDGLTSDVQGPYFDNRNWPIGDGGGSFSLASSPGNAGNYAVFRGLSGSSLTLTAEPTNARAPINAVQIVGYAPRLLVNDNSSDVDDGDPDNGLMTLREAVNLANAFPGPNQIDFDLGDAQATIVLGGSELRLTDDVTISGQGKEWTVISANDQSRVFHVTPGVSAQITDLSLTNGIAIGESAGQPESHGGAVFNDRGHLTISSSRIVNSTAQGGAGIANYGTGGDATLVLRETIVERNIGQGSAFGGGIYNVGVNGSALLQIENSTLVGNQARFGGAINNQAGTVEINNSTLSDNEAVGSGSGIGGAIRGNSGLISILNSTVSANEASAESSGGGGIWVDHAIILHNTIVAGNLSGSLATPSDIDGVSSSGPLVAPASSYNLIGDAATAGGLVAGFNNNIVGRDVSTILDPDLKDNGGPTPTHALIWGSPAIDTGKPDSGIAFDDARAYYTFNASDDAQATDLTANNLDASIITAPMPILSYVDAQQLVESTSPTATGTFDQADFFGSGSSASGHWTFNHSLPGGLTERYAFVATGTLVVSQTGQNPYTFAMGTDDGGLLRIDTDRNGFDSNDDLNFAGLQDFRETYVQPLIEAGSYQFEWLGFQDTGGHGFELSVIPEWAGNASTPVDEATGWKVIGHPTPHPEIRLDGQINVAVYDTRPVDPTFADGYLPSNEAIQLNGIDEYVELPDVFSGHDFSNGFSVDAWVYPTAMKHSARFFETGNGHGADQISFARAFSTDTLRLEVGENGAFSYIEVPNAIDLNTWQHFAATIDGNGLAKIYKDGKLLESGIVTVPATVARSISYIGRGTFAGDASFEGRIDHVGLYDRALTSSEIRDYYRLSSEFDQRGVPHNRYVDGDNDGSMANDIGAYESTYLEHIPVVVGVKVSSPDWTQRFLDHVDPESGVGYTVPNGDHQLDPLPWSNITQIHIQFSDHITDVTSSDIEVWSAAEVDIDSSKTVTFDVGSRTATITLADPIGRDKIRLILDDELPGSGALLDGDWTNGESTTSGNGIPGGDFDFLLHVLPGDTNQSGNVSVNDVADLRTGLGSRVGDAIYSVRSDHNGTGVLAVNDLGPIRENLGLGLPSNAPEPPGGPVAVAFAVPMRDVAAAIDGIDAVMEIVGREDDDDFEGLNFEDLDDKPKKSKRKSAFVS